MALSPTQAWVTGVSGVTGSGVGATRTLTFDTGLTATEETTGVTGSCAPFGAGGAIAGETNVPAFLEPDPTTAVRGANSNCMGPPAGGGSRTSRVELSKPVIAPVVHVVNLDASRLGITGTGLSLTQLAKNNALEVAGTTLNTTLQQALQNGCAANDGTNPNGGCGSFRLTASSPVTAFNLANNTANSPLTTAYNDSWSYTLSYPTAPLTKAFSPSRIPVGSTAELTFTIDNPDDPTQPTLSPMGFTDALPTGVEVADADVTVTPSCGSPTVTVAAGDTEVTATGVGVAPGASCSITVNVTSDTVGSYVNDTDNLSTTVANLVPDADTTLEVFGSAPAVPFACAPGAAGTLFQSEPVDVFAVDLITGESSQVATDADPRNVNAVGFNPVDGYVYGMGYSGAGTPTIKRVAGDWTMRDLGLPTNWAGFPGIPADWNGSAHVGEFDADGHLWISNGTSWAEIDLSDPSSPTYLEVVDAGALTPPPGWVAGYDWGFNVEDGDLYMLAFNSPATTPRRFALMRFDTDTHATSVVGTPLGALEHPDGQYAGAFGAVYSDPDGFLYASDNTTGGIWRVDMGSAAGAFFAEGPASAANDGARCFNSPLPIDFGDAPDSYGTSLGSDGPRHSIPGYDDAAGTAPLRLGAAIDFESDGQPGAAADGDGADEDAVADPIELVPGRATTVTVSATNDTDQPATLAGWVDLDGDGRFGNGAERVVVDL
ncbi:DUF6923 family protein, partial [Nocardioides sp. SYSU DS0663]|uniref:DUF7933 domain-containing protein n=1 Tax=Nocardioides sp. SYSU DS0663 TaxID=3416445 RepID=UPI003F4C39D8